MDTSNELSFNIQKCATIVNSLCCFFFVTVVSSFKFKLFLLQITILPALHLSCNNNNYNADCGDTCRWRFADYNKQELAFNNMNK